VIRWTASILAISPKKGLKLIQDPVIVLCAALAVVHYKLGQLEKAQDLYARAYDIQVSVSLNRSSPDAQGVSKAHTA